MAIREGRWDCTTCGTVGNLGRHVVCPNCGNPRAEGVRFYLPPDQQEVTDEAQLRQANAGADWLCQYCGSSNGAANAACKQCGAERGAARVQSLHDYTMDQVPGEGDHAPKKPAPPPLPQKKRSCSKLAIGCLGIFGALFLVLILLSLHTEPLTVRVSGFEWHRSITLEELAPVQEEDWKLPSGARLLQQRKDIHHYNPVLDHYEEGNREVSSEVRTGTRKYVCGQKDLGNGYFEDIECSEPIYETRTRTEHYREPVYRKVPVYQTRYTYEIQKWVPSRTENSSGKNHAPTWPAIAGNERETKRTEKYLAFFVDEKNKKEYTLEMSLKDWSSLELGMRRKAQLRGYTVLELLP